LVHCFKKTLATLSHFDGYGNGFYPDIQRLDPVVQSNAFGLEIFWKVVKNILTIRFSEKFLKNASNN
jgi:hypothetical protein